MLQVFLCSFTFGLERNGLVNQASDVLTNPKNICYAATSAFGGLIGSSLAVKHTTEAILDMEIKKKLISCEGVFCDSFNYSTNYLLKTIIQGKTIEHSVVPVSYWGFAFGSILAPCILTCGYTIATSGVPSCIKIMNSYCSPGSTTPTVQDYIKSGLTISSGITVSILLGCIYY